MIATLLGIPAGLLTTLAGSGGGLLLLLALAALWDPLTALTVTAPALLLGNAQRLWMYRRHVAWPTAGVLVLGAVPGSVLGGLLAVELPRGVLHGAMAGMVALAVAKHQGWLRWRPSRRALAPVGFIAGGINATSGGAGLLVAPALHASGLSGATFVATAALCAVSMHAGRLAAYGLGGQVEASTWGVALGLALTISAGNVIGARLRPLLAAAWFPRLELGAMVGAVGLLLLGVKG